MQLFEAHHQWATRPADERFRSLADMYEATRAYAAGAIEKTANWSELRVDVQEGDNLSLLGRQSVPAKLTHFAFGQLARAVRAPAGYLRALPATLAAQNLNHGLKHTRPERGSETAQLLLHSNGQVIARAITSERYERMWNYELIARLIDMSQRLNLVPAEQTMGGYNPDATRDRALYASEHDMFAFLMSSAVLTDPVGQALRRGVICVNSEVGDKALKFLGFMFRDVCANHIIWGAQEVTEVSLRHVGDIRGRMVEAQASVRRYLDGAASLDEAKFEGFTRRIAATKAEVVNRLFGIRTLNLSRKTLEVAYDAVKPEEDGDPRSVWGMAQGITRFSQFTPYADTRTDMDRTAGRLLDMADAF